MKNRTIFLAILVALAAFASFHYFKTAEREHSPALVIAAQKTTAPAPLQITPAPAVVAATPSVPVADTNTHPPEPTAKKRTTLRADAKPKTTALPAPRSKPPIKDPAARAALADVGVDPDAEDYWIQAINDPNLPAEERKDLIEDLNEDGLKDPHHPRPEDLAIIANRIALIEELAPDAADDVNAKAFAEAYKDLVNLWKGLPAD